MIKDNTPENFSRPTLEDWERYVRAAEAVYSDEIVGRGREATFRNESEIRASETCRCVYYGNLFYASDVGPEGWAGDPPPGDDTARCPLCGIDAVVGDASGLPVGDFHFAVWLADYSFGAYARMAERMPPERIRYTRTDVE